VRPDLVGVEPIEFGGGSQQADAETDDRDPPCRVGGQGIEQDEDGQVGRNQPQIEDDLQGADRDYDGEGADRVSAPEDDGNGQPERDRHQQEPVHPHRGPQSGQCQRDCEHAVDQPRVTAQPCVERGHATKTNRDLRS
jgi:hypothetical protein